jgi:hypothetical protein
MNSAVQQGNMLVGPSPIDKKRGNKLASDYLVCEHVRSGVSWVNVLTKMILAGFQIL